jgi:hypothetical protein
MNNIQTRLLELGLAKNNEALRHYSCIVESEFNKQQKFIGGLTQKHHKIPKCYYRKNKLNVDNSEENIVNLSYKDHILAHYYLALCAKGGWFKYKCEHAFLQMTGEYDIPETERALFKKLPFYEKIYADFVKRQSERRRGVPTTKGRISIYNNEIKAKKYVKEDELESYIGNGWIRGGTPHTAEEKISIGIKTAKALKGGHHSAEAIRKTSVTMKKRWRERYNGTRSRPDFSQSSETRQRRANSLRGLISINKNGEWKKVHEADLKRWEGLGWLLGTPKSTKQ